MGAASRFVLAGYFQPSVGTLIVNVLGSILLGFLMYNSRYPGYVLPRMKMFFGIGFLGSFTTFSAFSVQTFQMPANVALLNILGNTMLTLAGVFVGRAAVIYLAYLKESASYMASVFLTLTRHYSSYMAPGIMGATILFFPVMGGITGLGSQIVRVVSSVQHPGLLYQVPSLVSERYLPGHL
ncbi:fluoride efflux transporter CrcB [Methanolobus halotolerans]|uniref:Fluoride-specific ion channel FluC n=2 Tax=Methanolobus halotolerans TaxID=2052935 RepID=A0A4E0PYG5_9EURY|nr:fluoride efflux transporter CrcB [Methanolobus halotolerans]